MDRAAPTVSIAGNRTRVCVPDFAFCFGADLPPRAESYFAGGVMTAVTGLHLGLEPPDFRFADLAAAGGPALIADNACARDLVVGPAVAADCPAMDLAMDLAAYRARGRVAGRFEHKGGGVNVPPLENVPGDRVQANSGRLGRIGVTIAGAS